MTAAEQKRFERLATAIRRICAYQTPRQLERSSGRAYGLQYCEALEYAYENMRNEAMAVRSLVRPKRRSASATAPVAVDPVAGVATE
mgnify:CR=1 FL=1